MGWRRGKLVAVPAAARAAASAGTDIVVQVAQRGGVVQTADVRVGALMADSLADVAARSRAVTTAGVSAGANRARVGGEPVGGGGGGRARRFVC